MQSFECDSKLFSNTKYFFQEWEFLLLSKLDWDLSAVIAPDFIEHILQVIMMTAFFGFSCSPVSYNLTSSSFSPSVFQRLLKLDLAWDISTTREKVSTLVCLAYSQPSLASLPPSLLATSSILTTLRPGLETGALLSAPRDTPSPSSSSSSCSHSPLGPSSDPLLPLLVALERITSVERREVLATMERLEALMQASLPPSPEGSEDEATTPPSSLLPSSSSSPLSSSSRRLFPSTIESTSSKLTDL